MRLYRGLPARADGPIALTIGNFDGVHRGHQAMLLRLCEAAEDLRLTPAVLTFDRDEKLNAISTEMETELGQALDMPQVAGSRCIVFAGSGRSFSAGADLSEDERAQVRALLTSTQGLRDGTSYALVSTAVDALEKLEADVTLGIAGMTETGSFTESQIRLVGALNEGRLAVTQQQLLVLPTPELIPKNELYGHLGVESGRHEAGSLEHRDVLVGERDGEPVDERRHVHPQPGRLRAA